MNTVVNELARYNMDLVALQETRWPDNGEQQAPEYRIYYSGTKNNTHYGGVGFAVRNRLVENVLKFEAVDERLCYLRIKGRFKNISLISYYAPTEESIDENKDLFYSALDDLFQKIPNYDVKILLGDANAQVGKEDIWGTAIGKESLHSVSNDNGSRLLSFSNSANMCVTGTIFHHKNIHKHTWVSPDGQTRNQIDHILIDQRHRRTVMDVRSMRGAECGSDHFLVLMKLRQRLATTKRNKHKVEDKINFEKLKTLNLVDTFQIELNNRFAQLDNEDDNLEEQDDIETKWNTYKTTVKEVAKKVIGTQGRNTKKPWFDEHCMEEVEKRKKAKLKWLNCQTIDKEIYRQQYIVASREVTRFLRKKKRDAINNSLQKAENDRTKNNAREFYRTTRFFKQGFKPRTCGIKDNEGNVTNERARVLEIWKQYFEDLLNCEPTDEIRETPADEQNVTLDDEENTTDEPTFGEVQKIIKNMKGGKSPGEDGIPIEVLKSGGEAVQKFVYKLILKIWKMETIPSEWNEAVVIPLHKKGDKLQCTNYRGISLLNTTYKILSKLILNRLNLREVELIGDHQAGFVKERSTIDQIYVFKEIVSKCWEFQKEVHALFIDFKKAYDSIKRDQIWNYMKDFGIPSKLIRLCKLCVLSSKVKVRIENEYSETFDVNTGVRQGDGLSPLLFNIVLEKSLRKTKLLDKGINVGAKVNLLAFADDIVLLGENKNDLITLAETLIEEAKKIGLLVNEEKTKYLRIGRDSSDPESIQVGNLTFHSCQEFKYLGVTVTSTNREDKEIEIRLAAANRCLWSLQKLMSSKILSRTTKLRIYKTIIQPVLLYGSEVWALSKLSEKKTRHL
uniref:Craniofacial development protein 2 n=1 Tax=Cacopsylla melanoneura TaxID=428564 RepID=A0A8D9ELZ3_9HEMI